MPDEPDPEGESPCALDEMDVDGTCLPKGLPGDLACPPGEQLTDDDGCVPAGVPPSRCAEGFEARDQGCDAVLPVTPCPAGQMALPGETTCRSVAPCPADGWGDIPVEAGAIHVDASFAGTPDGSEAAPWPTIQQAVDAAEDGDQILVAAGTYAEHVTITGKGLRLWGVCPQQVSIEGPPDGVGAIDVIQGAHGTEIHRVGISGAYVAVGVSDATSVLLQEIWVHDTGDQGLLADRVLGPAELTVRGSLVESTGLGGIVVVGAKVTLEDDVFRDTAARGVDVFASPQDGGAAGLVADRIVVDHAVGGGIVVASSSATVSRAVVLDTDADASGQRGWGVAMFDVPGLPAASGKLIDAVVERSHDAGVIASASSALVDGVTVRDVSPTAMGPGSVGITMDAWSGTSPDVTGTIRQSLVEGATGLGLFVGGARDVMIEGVQVRDTEVDTQAGYGWGMAVQIAGDLGQAASATVIDSAVRHTVGRGVFVYGSALTLETTAVIDSSSEPSGRFGSGLGLFDDPSTGTPSVVNGHASLVSGSAEGGIVAAGSELVLDQCEIAGTDANGLGTYGDGVLVFGSPTSQGPSRLSLSRSRVRDSARAGVACFGATVAVESSVIACNDYALNTETYLGQACELTDEGGNACGCEPLSDTCKAVSSSLEPPQVVGEPFEPEH